MTGPTSEPRATSQSVQPIGDRLANERTLLAWLRTAIALMGFGVVVARFGVFLDTMAVAGGQSVGAGDSSRWMGAGLLLTGTLVVLLGAGRTRAYARSIGALGRPPGERPLVVTVACVTLLGIVLMAWVLLL
jgi:putative membrane protein